MAKPKRQLKQNRAANVKRKAAPTSRAPRANAAEKERRTNQIMTMLLSGARRPEICQFTRDTWGLTDRHVDRYIAAANTLIKAEASKERDEIFTEQAALRRMLRKRAIGDGDLRLALDVAKDEAKLHDLYPAQRIKDEVTLNNKPAEEMSDEELAVIAARGRPSSKPGDIPGPSGSGAPEPTASAQ